MKKLYVRLAFLGILVVILTVSVITYRNLENYTEEVRLVRHSNEVIKETELIMSIIKDAETGQRGFQLTGDTIYLDPYFSAISLLPKRIKFLDSLVNDSRQEENVDSLKLLIRDQFLIISNILANVERSGLYMDRYESNLLSRSRRNMDAIRVVGNEILTFEKQIFEKRANTENIYEKITPLSLLFYMIISLIGVIFLFTRIVTALDKSKEAERQLSENLIQQKLQIALVEERKVLLNEAESLSQMGSWKWTETNNEVVWSDGLYAIFDKKPGQVNSLNNFLENVMPDDRSLMEKFLQEVITEKKGSKIDYRIIKGDQVRYLSVTAKPQRISGKVDGVILGAVIDITESKVYEKQLQQYNEELKRSNEDLEQFAYVASHDLQEPLRKIRAFGDRLTAKYSSQLKEQGVDYIIRMQAAAARMQLLIDDLLSFSRVSRAEGEFQLLDSRSILVETLEDMDLLIKQEEADVRIGTMPDFHGDRLQIKRLFQNLVGNAVKFHKPDEKPVIDVSGKLVETSEIDSEVPLSLRGAQFVRFSIKDNGIGFDEKYAEKIFNIFQRLNGRTAYDGTGIGLAICRKIVENHKGYIAAKSIENIGSEFIVIFPTDLTINK
jgi:signal transduction histidine kinase/CHASE3 domain sensor protein